MGMGLDESGHGEEFEDCSRDRDAQGRSLMGGEGTRRGFGDMAVYKWLRLGKVSGIRLQAYSYGSGFGRGYGDEASAAAIKFQSGSGT